MLIFSFIEKKPTNSRKEEYGSGKRGVCQRWRRIEEEPPSRSEKVGKCRLKSGDTGRRETSAISRVFDLFCVELEHVRFIVGEGKKKGSIAMVRGWSLGVP